VRTIVLLCGLARVASADDVVWNDAIDASTCFAERPSLDDWSLVDSWVVIGPMRDPAHAGWAAIDGGCGRTSIGLRVDRRPVTPADGVTTLSAPIRLRLGADWTAYAAPVVTTELGNTPLALARRIRALSPFHWLTTIDVAALAPTSSSRADRAAGVGVGAAVMWTALSVTTLHATLTFDAERASGGGTLLVGAEWHWLHVAELVADFGQREDGAYHAWASFGVRALARWGLMPELAITRDRHATGAWLALALVR